MLNYFVFCLILFIKQAYLYKSIINIELIDGFKIMQAVRQTLWILIHTLL